MLFVSSAIWGAEDFCRYYRNLSPSFPVDLLHEQVSRSVREGNHSHFVSVVVPMYRELGNGNLIHLLKNFSDQGASPQQFELVVLVNNTPEVAQDRENPSREEKTLPSGKVISVNSPQSIWQENQQTLQLLRYVAGDLPKSPEVLASLPQWQQDVIQRAKRKGIRLVIHDLATEGVERNMGVIRDEGVQAALKRHESRGASHIIAMLDADTRVNDGYIENIAAHFADPKLNSLFLSSDWRVEPGSEPSIYQTTYGFRLPSQVNELVAGLQQRYSGGGGPQTVSRGTLFREVGGVPHYPMGEDGALAMDLSEKGFLSTPHSVNVFIGDRFRPDGYDALARHDLGVKDRFDAPINVTLLVGALSHRVNKQKKLSVKEAKAYFDHYGVAFNPRLWKRAFGRDGLKAPKNRFSLFEHRVAELIRAPDISRKTKADQTVNFLKNHLDGGDRKILEDRLSETSAEHEKGRTSLRNSVMAFIDFPEKSGLTNGPKQSAMANEFLLGNGWIETYLSERVKAGKRAEEIFSDLEADFPDWFLPFDKTPTKQFVERSRTARLMVREAVTYQNRFPSLQKILDVASGDTVPSD